MEDLHLFYVESNFHLILAESFIESKRIDASDVLFVTHRGVKLPTRYKANLLYDGTISQFKERVQLYRKDKERFRKLFKNRKVCSYSPFQFLFPRVRYFAEYNLLEEGFSAYSLSKEVDRKKALQYELFKAFYIGLSFPFASRNIKGFLMGISYSSSKPASHTKLLVSNGNAYGHYDFGDRVDKQIVPISGTDCDKAIRGQRILVLDRMSKKGRPFDDNIYLSVLKEALSRLGINNQSILVKLHPADSTSDSHVKKRVFDTLSEIGVSSVFMDYNLEELALGNNNNTFIGSNSTILYYAPIFGNTNKSVSFSRLLAVSDKQYARFLEGWGGVENFCGIFSKEVDCL